MKDEATIFVVDDDSGMRESLRWLIESMGLAVETYASAHEFLRSYDPAKPGCLVLDVRLPGLSGLKLQEELATRNVLAPIIMISGYPDLQTALRAMKAGAIDFLEKPFSDEVLANRIRQAVDRDRQEREMQSRLADLMSRAALLTRRERDVMREVVAGKSNKVIAVDLGLSQKTVEVHRAKVMHKMRLGSVAELVRATIDFPELVRFRPRDMAAAA